MKALSHTVAYGVLLITAILLAGCGAEELADEVSTCLVDIDCDDGNPCTRDSCATALCASVIVLGLACDDGNPCTENTECNVDGLCRGGGEVTTSDDPCQTCTCTADGGLVCESVEAGTTCDDNDCCTTDDQCGACDPETQDCGDAQSVCGGSAKNCSDDNECTEDICACEDGSAACSNGNLADGMPCAYSENDCTEGDICVAGQCSPGPPRVLDDLNPCTTDLCVKGEVVHEPITAELGDLPCDDGNECTTSDSCFLGACVGQDEVACDTPTCAAAASCVAGEGCVPSWLPEGAVCDDANTCTGGDHCNADHECVPKWNYEFLESLPQGTDMDDGDPCTKDYCVDGAVKHDPASGEACDDGDICTDNDTCAAGSCVGAAVDCSDGVSCTADQCAADGSCVSTPDDNACDDGDICTTDACDATTGCTNTDLTNPCADPNSVCCLDTCNKLVLPDGTCCPDTGFCPDADTTLSGTQNFDVVYIPDGVTVTCTGDELLEINVSGKAWIHGALSADGMDAPTPYAPAPEGACGGSEGGDGYRFNASGETTYCQTDAASSAACAEYITDKESYSGEACVYLATAPGAPGGGIGGGFGGEMGMMLYGNYYGGAAGGGGASFNTAGTPGEMSSNSCGLLNGGNPGAPYPWTSAGGSGGGGGGRSRNGDCGGCSGGSTGSGGHGGSGGGVIVLTATDTVTVQGEITARGGDGSGGAGPSGPTGGKCFNPYDCDDDSQCVGADYPEIEGNCYASCSENKPCPGEAICSSGLCYKPSVCTGGGGGGSGGVVKIEAPSVLTPGNSGDHLMVSGGTGGAAHCTPAGDGGQGGEGYLIVP